MGWLERGAKSQQRGSNSFWHSETTSELKTACIKRLAPMAYCQRSATVCTKKDGVTLIRVKLGHRLFQTGPRSRAIVLSALVAGKWLLANGFVKSSVAPDFFCHNSRLFRTRVHRDEQTLVWSCSERNGLRAKAKGSCHVHVFFPSCFGHKAPPISFQGLHRSAARHAPQMEELECRLVPTITISPVPPYRP